MRSRFVRVRSRLEALLSRRLSRLLGLLLVLQSGLIVTGGAVRITGSGLGCPTWPKCTDLSYTPVPHQPQGQLHVWIEFGNRLLTFALLLVALISMIAVILLKRHDIKALAIGQVVGILAQIPLGGITVLTHLNPIAVASHFMLSIILIAACTSLYERRKSTPSGLPRATKKFPILAPAHLILSALVVIVGTIVTGSGPNAGDYSAPRFHIRLETIARIHGDLAIALLLVTIIFYFATGSSPFLRRRIAIFGIISLLQGAIGFLQYYQGLPELLVGAHLLGVTLVWISAWRIRLAAK
ncbi:MAG TPA: COX15/CtaA family protein [Candidatus Paceibacterota bacterium]|nr:COX15/CtaA family protein [Candidatus Paceibacterota bacterium]